MMPLNEIIDKKNDKAGEAREMSINTQICCDA